MADVSHELGSLRYVVDSPLSSKVAMFNNHAHQHQQSQLLNPFSGVSGRSSPKPSFNKDEYGKPLAGSLTEMRGQKANIHVLKEMLELCQIIDSEGYKVNDEPNMRVIPFGELFNIYNYISDKVVGILLRARKHKLVDFEGEMLFQRRDDDVPVFLLKPIQEIRRETENKIGDIKRASSPAPQSTSVLLDKSAHQLKLQEAGLTVPSRGVSKSRTPSPGASKAQTPVQSKAGSPAPEIVIAAAPEQTSAPAPDPIPEPTAVPTPEPPVPAADAIIPSNANEEVRKEEPSVEQSNNPSVEAKAETVAVPQESSETNAIAVDAPQVEAAKCDAVVTAEVQVSNEAQPPKEKDALEATPTEVESASAPETQDTNLKEIPESEYLLSPVVAEESKTDLNNNNNQNNNTDISPVDVPTIVIEASAVYVRNDTTNEDSTPAEVTNAPADVPLEPVAL